MGRIHVLSTHLVNKIAAGEVIERPASVVKELVENAIDAGATRIDISIEKGGRQCVAVTDNGGGMNADDLALALVPHATSKIASDDDLFAISTMGFRGEALASIASVSHTHVRTAQSGQSGGWEIEGSGETVGQVRPCPAGTGTTVTVRDLFFNTPARRKFMKADPTEFGHISEALTRIALANTGVAFTLSHNGKGVLKLPACQDIRARVADLFGELAEDLLLVPQAGDSVTVHGLAGKPSAGRASARWQYFFLNGRYVRDRNLSHALKEAYRGLMDPSRFPAAMLYLQMPPEEVDVNVHPTKIEVRFRDGHAVHQRVLLALRQALGHAELRPAANLPASPIEGAELPDDERRQSLRQALAEFFKSQATVQGRLHFPQTHDRPERQEPAPLADPRPIAPPPLGQPWQDKPRREEFSSPIDPRPAGPQPPMESAPSASAQAQSPGSAMQVHNTYLLLADEQGLIIIDQHALHERVLYDQLLGRILSGSLESQRLLLPATMKVTPVQRAALDEHGMLLARLGIEVEDFGPDSVAIHCFPSFLNKVEPTTFLADALDTLAEVEAGGTGEQLLHQLLDMMACKAAVKAGDPLTQQEITALLAQRKDLDKATSCPHGRPTQIRLTIKDLEKQFKRI